MTDEQKIGGLDPSHSLAEDLGLPILPDLGAVARMRQAVDAAAVHRKGVVLTGPKGCGKGTAIDWVLTWFRETEKAKHDEDGTYRRRRVLRVGKELRDSTYREIGVALAKTLDPRYSDRVRGVKKDLNQIRLDFVQLCLKRNYAVIIADEGERCSNDAFLFLRDLITDAEEEDKARGRMDGSKTAAGVGVVLVGVESVEDRIMATDEAGERWVTSFRVGGLSPDEVVRVMGEWFPGFEGHIRRTGTDAWKSYLTSGLFRGTQVSFRLLENLARTYVHHIARTRPEVDARERIPFHVEAFERALAEITWSHSGTGREASLRIADAPKKGRRSA